MSLSIPTVLNSEQSRRTFCERWKSDWICLYDDDGPSYNSTTSILQDRLLAEGCRAVLLSGGYQDFAKVFPDYCTRTADAGCESDKTVLGLRNLQICNRSESDLDPTDCDSGFSKESDTSREAWHTKELFRILDHLFLGNAETAADLKLLQDNNIRYVLNVTPNLPNVFETENTLGIKYMQIPIEDCVNENLSAYFDDAIGFIDEARRNHRACLVHCRAGISRSVTVTVAYLMQKFSVPMMTALDFVKKVKTDVSPNFNFMGQLMEFQSRLNVTESRIVPQSSADEGVPWSPDESLFALDSILTERGDAVRP